MKVCHSLKMDLQSYLHISVVINHTIIKMVIVHQISIQVKKCYNQELNMIMNNIKCKVNVIVMNRSKQLNKCLI